MSEKEESRSYKVEDYNLRVGRDPKDGKYVAHSLEFKLLVAHGDTIEEAIEELHFYVTLILEEFRQRGEAFPTPYNLRPQF